ncbi:uncharacterized protein LOC142324655 [Lycorma delicatula]|uniref:uncharacterized protein LOC142324655 n=1 Tax=Lycorma delicatula TaxID=130591 RepID=UPI003F5173B2
MTAAVEPFPAYLLARVDYRDNPPGLSRRLQGYRTIRRDSLTTKSHYPITIHRIVYNLSIDDLAGKLPANSVVGKYQAPNPPSRKAGYYIYMFVVFRHEKVYNVSFTRLEGNSR